MLVMFGDLTFRARDLRAIRTSQEKDPYGRNNPVHRVTVIVNIGDSMVTQAHMDFAQELTAMQMVQRLTGIMGVHQPLDGDDHKLIDMKAEELGSSVKA